MEEHSEGQRDSDWIKVEKGLPPMKHPVLCWDGVNHYVACQEQLSHIYWAILGTEDATQDRVTHWCYLPNPPDMPD
jgi:hypothetical protein